jgi:hypothetical protein
MANYVKIREGALQSTQLDYILVDGSASMMNKWWDCMGALDGFITTLKTQGVSSHGIIQVFDSHDLDYVARDSEIGTWRTFGDDPIGAHWGATPLYDAIFLMGQKLQAMDPDKASIVIVTDGEETGSQVNDTQARAVLDWCRAKGWQVTFIGCDFNNSRQAKLLGADESNSIGVQKAKLLEAGKAFGDKRAKHAKFGDDISFSPDERKNFGGYLTNGNGK